MKLYARISDNVFDPKEWTTVLLEFDRNDFVSEVEVTHRGVYSLNMMGWDIASVVEWQNYDPSGDHPENYQEISIDGKTWKSYLTLNEVLHLIFSDVEKGDECPNCQCGTLGQQEGDLVCQGECGMILHK
jgi:hypothetical protein